MRDICKIHIFRSLRVFMLLMLIAVTAACSKESKPPILTAERLNGEQMSTTLGTYLWENTNADSMLPTEQVRHEEVHIFQKKDGIRLDFDEEEPFQIKANLMSMEDPQAAPISVISRGTTLTLPDQAGYYALQIWAEWDNEDYASYALSIQIE